MKEDPHWVTYWSQFIQVFKKTFSVNTYLALVFKNILQEYSTSTDNSFGWTDTDTDNGVLGTFTLIHICVLLYCMYIIYNKCLFLQNY